ncbi:hypothetical protein BDZ91DRAFT_768289 [Kalaharituber pfeilii]|nr:hypothetical protein BDZ91DRAFT_768289 [Kalaharituber pfeilii]
MTAGVWIRARLPFQAEGTTLKYETHSPSLLPASSPVPHKLSQQQPPRNLDKMKRTAVIVLLLAIGFTLLLRASPGFSYGSVCVQTVREIVTVTVTVTETVTILLPPMTCLIATTSVAEVAATTPPTEIDSPPAPSIDAGRWREALFPAFQYWQLFPLFLVFGFVHLASIYLSRVLVEKVRVEGARMELEKMKVQLEKERLDTPWLWLGYIDTVRNLSIIPNMRVARDHRAEGLRVEQSG